MTVASLNWFDWLLVILLTWSTFAAFRRGIVIELFTLGGLVLGVLLASWNYHNLAPRITFLTSSPGVANTTAFLLLAFGVMIAAALAGRMLHQTVDVIGLGFLDRLGGAIFGFLRGCLLGIAILMAAVAFLPGNQAVENSRLSSYFLTGAHAVSFVVPHDLHEQIRKGAEEIKHNAPGWIKP